MTKKLVILVLIALGHFGTSILIVATSLSIASGPNSVPAETSLVFRILVAATRVIHFPIISLSWYSRQWFPGNWIYVPMLVNSFIWAIGIYVVFMLGQKMREKLRD